jgi:hypothetical protein
MQFDTLHLTFRFFPSFSAFFLRLCPIRFAVRTEKREFVRVSALPLNMNYVSSKKKKKEKDYLIAASG